MPVTTTRLMTCLLSWPSERRWCGDVVRRRRGWNRPTRMSLTSIDALAVGLEPAVGDAEHQLALASRA